MPLCDIYFPPSNSEMPLNIRVHILLCGQRSDHWGKPQRKYVMPLQRIHVELDTLTDACKHRFVSNRKWSAHGLLRDTHARRTIAYTVGSHGINVDWCKGDQTGVGVAMGIPSWRASVVPERSHVHPQQKANQSKVDFRLYPRKAELRITHKLVYLARGRGQNAEVNLFKLGKAVRSLPWNGGVNICVPHVRASVSLYLLNSCSGCNMKQ